MKNKFLKTVSLTFLGTVSFAQVTSPFNSSTFSPQIVGFDGTTVGLGVAKPLVVRNAFNQPILFQTNGTTERMSIAPGNAGTLAGFVAIGNNLAGFVAQDRLHLHHDFNPINNNVRIRFTHSGTAATSADGSTIGINNLGDFRLTQFENKNTDIFTPNAALNAQIQRFRIMPNGQVLVGTITTSENVEYGAPIPGFSEVPSSVLNVRGPINSCADFSVDLGQRPTILYGWTTPTGNPGLATNEGFRMHMTFNFRGLNHEALVFEKTDHQTNDPDGVIAFTNTGIDNTEELSAYYNGRGRAYIGKDIDTPLNTRLTIESVINDPNTALNDAELSGLRFVNLPNTSTSITNPTNKVLSVNNFGDVILVNDVSGGGGTVSANNGLSVANSGEVVLGQNFGQAGNPGGLISNREIPMNGKHLFFSNGSSPVSSRVGIGIDNGAINSKLHVRSVASDNANQTVIIENEMGGSTAGLVVGLSGSGSNKGQVVNVNNGSLNFGTEYNISGGTSTQGVVIGVNGSGISWGVNSKSTGSSYNIGVYGEANGGSYQNIGIYGYSMVGPNSLAGKFQGDVEITNNLAVAGVVSSPNMPNFGSDQIFKINIDTIANSLDLVKNLEPKSFYFDTLNTDGFHFSSKKQYGFVAQDIQEILPELVYESIKLAEYDSLGNEIYPAIEYKSLNYNAFIAILTDAVQEQQAQLEDKDSTISAQQAQLTEQQNQLNDLNSRLAQIESCLANLGICEVNQQSIHQTNPEEQAKLMQETKAALEVKLSDKNTVVLSQNVPNPFAEMTTINYNIPTTVKEAQIHFYTNRGVLIHSVDISERGKGELRVFAEDLSSGLYTYSLVADGKVVATKKMMKN